MKNTMLRISDDFYKEVKEIKKAVKEISKKKYSDREITMWIVRHENWKQMKEDIAQKLIKDAEPKRGRRYKDE